MTGALDRKPWILNREDDVDDDVLTFARMEKADILLVVVGSSKVRRVAPVMAALIMGDIAVLINMIDYLLHS